MSQFTIDEKFSFGRIIHRTFLTIKSQLKLFFLWSFILIGLPSFFMSLFVHLIDSQTEFLFGLLQLGFGGLGVLHIVLILIAFIIYIAGLIIAYGMLTDASIDDFAGNNIDLTKSFDTAKKNAWSLVLFSVLQALGVILGLILLIIPGIVLVCMWAVGRPALIREEVGAIEAFGRSIQLAYGYKWWIFLLALFYFIGVLIVASISEMIIMSLSYYSDITINFTTAIIDAIIDTITTLIIIVGVASLYFELRLVKEGVGADSIYDVFD